MRDSDQRGGFERRRLGGMPQPPWGKPAHSADKLPPIGWEPFCAIPRCSVRSGSGGFAGQAGKFLVINQSAVLIEPDQTGRAAAGKGKLCGQLARAVEGKAQTAQRKLRQTDERVRRIIVGDVRRGPASIPAPSGAPALRALPSPAAPAYQLFLSVRCTRKASAALSGLCPGSADSFSLWFSL